MQIYFMQLYFVLYTSLSCLKNNVKAHKIIEIKTFKFWGWNIKTLKGIKSKKSKH